MFQIIGVVIILFIFLILIARLKIVISIDEDMYMNLYIFNVIKIRKYKLNEKEVKHARKKSAKIATDQMINYLKDIEITNSTLFVKYIIELLSKVEFKELNFEINVNLNDYILNAYVVAMLNSMVAMLISKNINHIDMNNLNYLITSNEKKTKLKLKCIMYGKFTNIIVVIIKVVKYAFDLKKRGNVKHGKGTSNRKFNGDSNVIARGNG